MPAFFHLSVSRPEIVPQIFSESRYPSGKQESVSESYESIQVFFKRCGRIKTSTTFFCHKPPNIPQLAVIVLQSLSFPAEISIHCFKTFEKGLNERYSTDISRNEGVCIVIILNHHISGVNTALVNPANRYNRATAPEIVFSEKQRAT